MTENVRAKCGCVPLCPTHRSAPAMLQALKAIDRAAQGYPIHEHVRRAVDQGRAAIRAARGD